MANGVGVLEFTKQISYIMFEVGIWFLHLKIGKQKKKSST